MTKTHEARMRAESRVWASHASRRISEAQVEVDEKMRELIPRLAAATLTFEHEQQAFRLETWITDALVRRLMDYPGEHDRAWEYVGERMGYELTRQLKTLDFGAIVRGPRVVLGSPPPWAGQR